jgi:hypothetical protein
MALYEIGKSQETSLADFAPDLDPASPAQGQGILLDMDQCFPTLKGFQALNSAQPFVVGALPEVPIGSTVAYYSDGSTQEWAGGVNHLYRKFGSIWVQADLLGTGSFGATKWNFAQFNDDLIAVGGPGVAPQVATGSTGIFGPLGGGPPVGAVAVVAVNSQVLMFQGNQWFASAIGSDNNWTPDIQTQAGQGPVTDYPGDIVAAAVLYRTALVYKQTATWLFQYVGGQAVWANYPISDITGTWGQGSVIPLPDGIAWLGIDDFYFSTGYTPQAIPNNLKEWFFDTADPIQLQLGTTQSRYDPYHGVLWWYFVSHEASFPGIPDRYINYSRRAQRWGTGYLNVTSVPNPNTQPGVTQGLYFDTNNVLQSYTGLPGAARLKTGYYGQSGLLGQIMRVRPRYNTSPASQSLLTFHTDTIGNPDVAGPPGVLGADGWFYFRNYDRWHRWELRVVGTTEQQQVGAQIGAEVTAFSYEYRSGGIR